MNYYYHSYIYSHHFIMLHKLFTLLVLLVHIWHSNSSDPFLCMVPTRHGLVYAACPLKVRTGTCTKMMNCGFKYPEIYSTSFKCYTDLDCPEKMKCCEHPCYVHEVCVTATPPASSKKSR